MSIEEILKLPFEIQLVLAAGYLAYRVAVAGLDRAHKTTDIVFQVLTYGLMAHITYDLAVKKVPVGFAMVAAVSASIIAASIWRSIGRQVFIALIRRAKVTRENFSPSTWDHILHGRHKWAYIAVTCDDDVAYESNLQALPDGLPYDPLDLDMDGNIAIYVTRSISPKGNITDHGIEGALDEYGRAHLTYIPVSRIKNVTVSFSTNLTPATASSRAEAEQLG